MALPGMIKKKLKPRTFYDELAEYGYLHDYLNTFFADRLIEDKAFRESMYERIYNFSKVVVPDIEILYLEQLRNNMSYFLESIERCKILTL